MLLIRCGKAFLNFMFLFFKLLPVSEKVTFLSRQSSEVSADMKMLADEMKRQEPDLQTVFLCRMIPHRLIGKIGYCFYLFEQMYHIATSKIVILDSYCMGVSLFKQRRSLIVVQIWHALGALKKFGYSILDKKEGHSRKIAEAMNMHRHYDMIVSSSIFCIPHFVEAFDCDVENVEIASLPRVDLLVDHDHQSKIRDQVWWQYPILAEREVIVYAPTFRKKNRYSEKALEQLVSAVDLRAYNLVLKAHPLMDMGQYAHIDGILYDKHFSTIEMFAAADYVIVDYSAVIYEAALMNKPLFFYTYDMERYQDSRDFYIDYKIEMPGVISKDAGEIMDAISSHRYDLHAVEHFAKRYVTIQNNCTRDLAEKILKL